MAKFVYSNLETNEGNPDGSAVTLYFEGNPDGSAVTLYFEGEPTDAEVRTTCVEQRGKTGPLSVAVQSAERPGWCACKPTRLADLTVGSLSPQSSGGTMPTTKKTIYKIRHGVSGKFWSLSGVSANGACWTKAGTAFDSLEQATAAASQVRELLACLNRATANDAFAIVRIETTTTETITLCDYQAAVPCHNPA